MIEIKVTERFNELDVKQEDRTVIEAFLHLNEKTILFADMLQDVGKSHSSLATLGKKGNDPIRKSGKKC